MHLLLLPLPTKRGRGWKNIWLSGIDFKSWGGALLSGGLNTQRNRWELNSQMGLDSWCVTSVATLLLIIHITIYILISLVWQKPCHKNVMALFSHRTIKCCFGRTAYSKCCIIVYLSSCSVLVEEWCRILKDCLFHIVLIL